MYEFFTLFLKFTIFRLVACNQLPVFVTIPFSKLHFTIGASTMSVFHIILQKFESFLARQTVVESYTIIGIRIGMVVGMAIGTAMRMTMGMGKAMKIGKGLRTGIRTGLEMRIEMRMGMRIGTGIRMDIEMSLGIGMVMRIGMGKRDFDINESRGNNMDGIRMRIGTDIGMVVGMAIETDIHMRMGREIEMGIWMGKGAGIATHTGYLLIEIIVLEAGPCDLAETYF